MVDWRNVIGKVSFVNCDPLYHGLSAKWDILAAPPSWLTGHLLRKDCLVAPIPAADYAKHQDELILLRGIGIASDGSVGSVLLFSDVPLLEIESVALPSDSSTSKELLSYILAEKGLNPKYEEMGPDYDEMMENCDAALLIGDRALDEAGRHPERIVMDLGSEWKTMTGHPMVFGVFAARKDTDKDILSKALEELTNLGLKFNDNKQHRSDVVQAISTRSGFSSDQILSYFDEVINILDDSYIAGLERFLTDVCGIENKIQWLE